MKEGKENKRKMRGKKIIFSLVLALSICVTGLSMVARAADDISDGQEQVIGSNPIDPWEYQKLLGKGMDVDWSKTSGGRKYYSVDMPKAFRAAGVNHVRIRVKDQISETMLQALDQQIDDCLEQGLIPVLAYQANEFKNEPSEENIQKVADWWGTIAERYKDRSYLLSFDLLIEATDALNKQPEKLNELYEKIVCEIRKTNPKRIIMISPRLRSDAAYLSELKIPTQHNRYLMAEWHFYASGPSKTNERKLWTTGTDAEKKLITDKIQMALEWQEKNQVPTWVGAWMAGNYNDGNDYSVKEQIVFASFVTQQLTEAEIPFAVNSDTKFYDRVDKKWIEKMQPVFQCIYGNGNSANEDNDIADAGINKKIHVGFNAKGNLDTANQYKYVAKQLAQLKKDKADTSKIYLRLLGGTVSQKTDTRDWSASQIEAWAKLQRQYKCKYIFVVNFNDTAANQLKFYQRMQKYGIRFSLIELGNEQYLPKFAQARVGKYEEVTKRTANMSPAKYIKLSNEYMKVFKKYKLPFYVQFAPESARNQVAYGKWNTEIIKAINAKKFISDRVNGTIHLYERNGAGTLNENQISNLRKRIKQNIHIAVTESGVIDKKGVLSAKAYAQQELELTKRILSQMKSGDIFLNQVLYTDYKTEGSAVLHPDSDGLTVKGKLLMKYFKKYWL